MERLFQLLTVESVLRVEIVVVVVVVFVVIVVGKRWL